MTIRSKKWGGAALFAAAVILVATATTWADVDVRVATWNLEDFNPGDSTQLNAAARILDRVQPQVVCLQEIDEQEDLEALASAAGYSWYILASGTNSFDPDHHAAVMSMYPFASTRTETSITLSGDFDSRDLSRNFIVAEIVVPGACEDLVIIGNHWKSGFDDADEFRRSVESIRAMQVTADYDSSTVPYLVMGDMNDDIDDSADSPSVFNSLPYGLPMNFELGDDITFPVPNGVFRPYQSSTGAQRLIEIGANQLSGYGLCPEACNWCQLPFDATRAPSGRRLDYIWRSNAVTFWGSEVYDSQDDDGSGLPKPGPLPQNDDTCHASDHLMVFADISICDDSTGACCTACGCDDTVNEGQCLAMGGEFRGAGVACGEEVPPCPEPPNDMRINEIVVAHDGTQTQEFVEIVGQPHELLCGLTIMVIEGEYQLGRIDREISLDDCGGEICALDENGYFVAGGSGLDVDLQVGTGSWLFEDGTETFVLVRDALLGGADDVDSDNDGVEDTPIGTVLDAVALVDDDYPSATEAVYYSAPAFGEGWATDIPAGIARCPDGIDTDSVSDWVQLSYALDGSDGCVAPTPGEANTAHCGGDYDGDGDVDLADFAEFQLCFGQSTPQCAALELDGACGIDLNDLAVFVTLLESP